ncbi:MAG: hypothetical protein HQ565_09790 [Bacteroidetes bacterium]|nr:hypothetical protein [Bacteroidota bacterium]
MRYILYACVIVLSAISFTAGAQSEDITKINKQLFERPWLDNSIHDLYTYKITQIFGERPAKQRHSNLGPITNITYMSLDQMIIGVDTMDIVEEEKEKLKEKYKEEAQGGCIQLFIARTIESNANFRWFFIVIRGEDDKEKIMEIDLVYQAPQLPEANGWWNYTTVFFPKVVETPFYVYVNDRQSQYLSDFKFMISKK